MEAGVPGGLFSRQVTFATQSGGVVVVTAQARGVGPEIEELMTGRARGEALYALAGELGRRYPGCTAQALARGDPSHPWASRPPGGGRRGRAIGPGPPSGRKGGPFAA